MESLKNSLNKEIAEIGIHGNDLVIQFVDESTLRISDNEQICCEQRYMHTDDDLSYYNGSKLLSYSVREVQEDRDNDSWDQNIVESHFLVVETSKGSFTIVNYNEHNGYYGGFNIVAKEES